MKSLKYRLIAIGILLVASIASLWPRDVIKRVNLPDGSFRYDTVKQLNLDLGLDLKGGIFMALEIDESRGVITDKDDALDRAITVVRARIDQLGLTEPIVQKSGSGRINVELAGIDDPQRAQDLIKTVALLEFKITDETGELLRAIPRMEQVLKEKGISTAAAAAQPTPTKVNSLFNPDSAKKDSAAADSTPATDSAGALFSRIRPSPDIPGEYLVRPRDFPAVSQWLSVPEVRASLRPGKELYWGSDTVQLRGDPNWYKPLYLVDRKVILSGTDLVDADPIQDPTRGTVVNFRVNNVGARTFRQETQRNINNYMAIVLDSLVMGRPPVIVSAIGTDGQITMTGRPISDANDLALVLRAGALPVPLKIAQTSNIGPSLGQDSIDRGIRAAVLAVALVILIMIVYYRFSGTLAVLGLFCYVLMTLGVLASLGAVVTLPGVAGFVLSIGIAVDANVLIFERIREELDAGKTVRTAIDEGFRHAMAAIVDSNVTSILSCLVLYQWGTGPVRGFAVTLIAGVLASMITGIFIVRTFFMIWLNRTRGAQALSI